MRSLNFKIEAKTEGGLKKVCWEDYDFSLIKRYYGPFQRGKTGYSPVLKTTVGGS